MTDQTPIPAAVRHDGWTPARRTQFLDRLALDGSISAACSHAGMSREAAYRLRRRDALFARTWDAALVLARAASADVLANRAIDGVEEQIWYRGELVGTRRKYDSRLLLAHIARLDRIAETNGTEHEAGRFDELLALVGGEPVPQGIDCDEDGVPADRDVHMDIAADDAKDAFEEAWLAERPQEEEDDDGEPVDEAEMRERHDREVEEHRAYHKALIDEGWNAGIAAGAQWDAWRAQAHAAADRLLAAPLSAETPCTLLELSTSPAASAERAAPKPLWDRSARMAARRGLSPSR
ncbi:MAG: hypothetical protein ACXWIO_06175 [Croceibacterium sp.]